MNDRLLTEHQIQAIFVQEIKYEYRLRVDFIPALFYAVVNGFWAAGKGNAKFALMQKYKSEGMNPGVADLHYDQPRGQFTKLVIEFKHGDKRNEENGGVSSEQIEYLTKIRPYAFTAVCYSPEEAKKVFDWYMSLPVFGVDEKWDIQEILDGVLY